MPVELGLGVAEVLSTPGGGRVVGVYSKAAYLKLPGGLFALTTFDVPSGPIHLRCREPLDRLQVGDPVTATACHLQAGPLLIDLQEAAVWRGQLPPPEALACARDLALDLLGAAPAPALEPALLDSLAGCDPASLAERLAGRGPGLTPAGDDLLAGAMLIAHVFGVGGGPGAATAAPTNDVARAFLHWAARGQSIEPVHRLLNAAAAGHRSEAGIALEQVVRFGHSSGADLAAGLKFGLELYALPLNYV